MPESDSDKIPPAAVPGAVSASLPPAPLPLSESTRRARARKLRRAKKKPAAAPSLPPAEAKEWTPDGEFWRCYHRHL